MQVFWDQTEELADVKLLNALAEEVFILEAAAGKLLVKFGPGQFLSVE